MPFVSSRHGAMIYKDFMAKNKLSKLHRKEEKLHEKAESAMKKDEKVHEAIEKIGKNKKRRK